LSRWRNTFSPSLSEGRQRYTNCNRIFLRLCCHHGAVDIRVRGSLLLPDELYRFLPQFDSESTFERNRLSAIAKIKQDLAWRSVTGVPMSQIVITRQQAEELVAEVERLRATHK